MNKFSLIIATGSRMILVRATFTTGLIFATWSKHWVATYVSNKIIISQSVLNIFEMSYELPFRRCHRITCFHLKRKRKESFTMYIGEHCFLACFQSGGDPSFSGKSASFFHPSSLPSHTQKKYGAR